VHATTVDKSDDINSNFCKELEHVFNQYANYTKILIGDCNAKEWRKDIFKPEIRNESIDEISNNCGVTVLNTAMLICQEYNASS
jgi:hypothetical protein